MMLTGPMVSPAPVEVSEELFAPIAGDMELCYQTFGDPADEPLLLVVGAQDQTTPAAMARALYAQAALPAGRKELLVLADAGHMDASRKPPFREAFLRLLERAPVAAQRAAATGAGVR